MYIMIYSNIDAPAETDVKSKKKKIILHRGVEPWAENMLN